MVLDGANATESSYQRSETECTLNDKVRLNFLSSLNIGPTFTLLLLQFF